MSDVWVFWEDMWNEPENNKEQCCGEWNELGECSCKK